jgi:hypothetical protein
LRLFGVIYRYLLNRNYLFFCKRVFENRSLRDLCFVVKCNSSYGSIGPKAQIGVHGIVFLCLIQHITVRELFCTFYSTFNSKPQSLLHVPATLTSSNCFLSTQFTSFCLIHRINSDYFLILHLPLIFALEKRCVFCEAGTDP